MAVDLSLSPDTIRMLIQKARAAAASVTDAFESGGEHEIEFDVETLRDTHAHDGLAEEETEDLSGEEIRELLEDLNVDEAAELVAMVWIGRGDFEASDFTQVVEDAKERAVGSTAKYLLEMPLFADHLEAGLDAIDR